MCMLLNQLCLWLNKILSLHSSFYAHERPICKFSLQCSSSAWRSSLQALCKALTSLFTTGTCTKIRTGVQITSLAMLSSASHNTAHKWPLLSVLQPGVTLLWDLHAFARKCKESKTHISYYRPLYKTRHDRMLVCTVIKMSSPLSQRKKITLTWTHSAKTSLAKWGHAAMNTGIYNN